MSYHVIIIYSTVHVTITATIYPRITLRMGSLLNENSYQLFITTFHPVLTLLYLCSRSAPLSRDRPPRVAYYFERNRGNELCELFHVTRELFRELLLYSLCAARGHMYMCRICMYYTYIGLYNSPLIFGETNFEEASRSRTRRVEQFFFFIIIRKKNSTPTCILPRRVVEFSRYIYIYTSFPTFSKILFSRARENNKKNY